MVATTSRSGATPTLHSSLRAGRSSTRRSRRPAARWTFTGKYLQVLPDNGDNYNEVHSYESFVWTALEFRLSLGGRLLGRQSKLIFYHSKLRALDLRVSPFV